MSDIEQRTDECYGLQSRFQPLQETHMLTFIRESSEKTKDGHLKWICQCDCGNISAYIATRVRFYRVNFCKVCSAKQAGLKNKKHGMRKTPTYVSWASAKDRATNKKSKDFYRYGALGLGMAERWLTFENFLIDMGERPIGTSLDRINPNKGYELGNCRWATPTEQARNRKDLTIVLTKNGSIPLIDYAKKLGISNGTAHLRFKRKKLEGVIYESV
jgi:hypothetical protein